MTLSCATVCFFLLCLLVLPWLFEARWLGYLSISVGVFCICALAWLCASLVFHIYTGLPLPGISWVRHVLIRLFLPLMEIAGRFFGIDRQLVRRSFIKINNELVLASARKCEPQELLLLLPHCVQASACAHRLTHRADNCRRCGACAIAALLSLRDEFGFRLAIATGGTIARRIVVQLRPRIIIAVACERDLTSGIQDSYPLPVFGILNRRPHGPCQDTTVPVESVEKAMNHFIAVPKNRAEKRPLRPLQPR